MACLQVGDREETEEMAEMAETERASVLSALTLPTPASPSLLYTGLSMRTDSKLAACTVASRTTWKTNREFSQQDLLVMVMINLFLHLYVYF